MKTIDVTCPVCGRINKNLYLDETDGWMECEECHSLSHHPEHCQYIRTMRIPVYTMKGLVREVRAAGA